MMRLEIELAKSADLRPWRGGTPQNGQYKRKGVELFGSIRRKSGNSRAGLASLLTLFNPGHTEREQFLGFLKRSPNPRSHRIVVRIVMRPPELVGHERRKAGA